MDEAREQVIGHILDIDKRFYLYLQRSRIPQWAEVDLTMPQLKLLFLVGGGGRPMPNSHVARALGMTLSTTTGVVDRLVAQGLIRRLEDRADRRIVLLQTTPEGSALLERLLRAGLGYFRQILDRLTPEELRTVSRAFDLLHETAMALASDRLPAVSDQPSAVSDQHPASSHQPSAVSNRPSDWHPLTAES